MTNYSASVLSIGMEVCHKTNVHLKMIIIDKIEALNQVTCRWVDSKGNSQKETFLAQELLKYNDVSVSSRFGI